MGNTDSRTHPVPETRRNVDVNATGARQNDNTPRVRVLIVGSSMSGKTTLVQQLRLHYEDRFHKVELENLRSLMIARALKSLRIVLRNVYIHGLSLDEDSRFRGRSPQEVFAETRNALSRADPGDLPMTHEDFNSAYINTTTTKMQPRCSVLPSCLRILMLLVRNSSYNPASHLFSNLSLSSYRSFVTSFVQQLHAFSMLESMEDISLFKLISPRIFRLPTIPTIWTSSARVNTYQNVLLHTLLHEPVTPEQAKYILSHQTLKNLNLLQSLNNMCTWLTNLFGIPIMRPIHPQQFAIIRPAESSTGKPQQSRYCSVNAAAPIKGYNYKKQNKNSIEHAKTHNAPPHVLLKPKKSPHRVFIPKGSIVSMADVLNKAERTRNTHQELNGQHYWHSTEIATAKGCTGVNHRDRLFHTKMDDSTVQMLDSTIDPISTSFTALNTDATRRPQGWVNGAYAREWDIGKVRPFELDCLLDPNDEQMKRLVYRHEGYRARHVPTGGARSVLFQVRQRIRTPSSHLFSGVTVCTKDPSVLETDTGESPFLKVVKRIQPHGNPTSEGTAEWFAMLHRDPKELRSTVSAEVRSLYAHTFLSRQNRTSTPNHALAAAAMIDDSLSSSPIKNALLPSRIPEIWTKYRDMRKNQSDKDALHPYAAYPLSLLKSSTAPTDMRPIVKHMQSLSTKYKTHVEESLLSLDKATEDSSEQYKTHIQMVSYHNIVFNPRAPEKLTRQSVSTLLQRQEILAGCYVLGTDDGFYAQLDDMQLHYQQCIQQRLEQAKLDPNTPSVSSNNKVSSYFTNYLPPSIDAAYDDHNQAQFISKTQQRQFHAFLKNQQSISSTSSNQFSLSATSKFVNYSSVVAPGFGIGFAPELSVTQRTLRYQCDQQHLNSNIFLDPVNNMTPHVNQTSFYSMQHIQEGVESTQFDNTLANHISKIWADRGLASTLTFYMLQNKDHNSTYFQNNLPKILGKEPISRNDIVMTTVPTLGIHQHTIPVKDTRKGNSGATSRTKFILELLDTGGKLHDRRSWVEPLHSVDIVVYVLNQSHFDIPSDDVEGLNSLIDGLKTLQSFAKAIPTKAKLVIFLNGLDMFAYKQQACFGNFCRYVPEYTGPNVVEKITVWLMHLCEKVVKPHDVKLVVGSAIEERVPFLFEFTQLFESVVK